MVLANCSSEGALIAATNSTPLETASPWNFFGATHSGGVNKNGGLYISQTPKTSCMAGWWLNQPIWKKICASTWWIFFPNFRGEHQKMFETTTQMVYLLAWPPPLKLPSFEGKSSIMLSVSGWWFIGVSPVPVWIPIGSPYERNCCLGIRIPKQIYH